MTDIHSPNTDTPVSFERSNAEYNRRTVYFLAAFYGASGFARLFIQAVVPLKALSILGQPAQVSLAYFLAGASSLCASICLPHLASAAPRHVVALCGAISGLVGLTCLATGSQTLFAVGLTLQAVSVTLIEIVISMYALDNLRRTDFGHYEPVRLFFGGTAFVVAPMCGILSEELHPIAPFALSALALVIVGLLALGARRLKTHKQARLPNPLQLIQRFFSQPRMALAYVLATGRSAWWTMFFIFAPMYVVTHGYSKVTATAVVTISMCFLLTVPLWGWVARRVGMRRMLPVGFGLCAVFSALAGILTTPLLAIICLLLASNVLGALDGVGNAFFLRAVRPLQRVQMAAVFQTFRDVGTAGPQLAFAGILIYGGIGSVFVVSAIGMVSLASLSRYLPRKM